MSGHTEGVKVLLRFNVDTTLKRGNKTAKALADLNQNPKIVALL
jgi:hypothetical protein